MSTLDGRPSNQTTVKFTKLRHDHFKPLCIGEKPTPTTQARAAARVRFRVFASRAGCVWTRLSRRAYPCRTAMGAPA
jgi:hypothetical protein